MVGVVKTGIEEIDSALGGGIVDMGNLLISHDKRSLGWVLGLKIFKSMIDQGAIGVILNTTLPISKLQLRTKCAGLDLEKEGKAGKLYIIDLFGSKYDIPYNSPYVIQIRDWSGDTGIPKLLQIYSRLSSRIPEGSTVVGLAATLEGLYHEFGKQTMDNLIRASLASFENEVVNKGRKINILTIALLNREAVPDYVTAWLYSLSDQIIEFISNTGTAGLEETILIPRSLVPEFQPRHYTIKLSKEHRIQVL
ncbi:Hypothetical protein TON_0674 [Thermococcus onnurineus NA1]|uniref:KaiC-like domain-containing protein n=1 Tax=Thermococcus onnurineus (strain NA1) TaxID=523850 RepID=B6YV83_THEON|nr:MULTISPECIES: hypothetical protein [Thermococcus]ACJ16161.1 Hypothetical protein TON_0674 [Thermococcus onnurineus NA1]NJE47309.1 hypothetical protein [Thermococcus sp. GR7]NJE78674.1 hypothetical protein [Thermococcus sp. GR4]NJF23201.1 hypothetical protein [Thermococcus sp. GR5]